MNYEFWLNAYRFGWATEEDLVQAVTLGILTQEEMDAILNAQ